MDAYRLLSYQSKPTPPRQTMSTYTISSLKYLTREQLSAQLLSASTAAAPSDATPESTEATVVAKVTKTSSATPPAAGDGSTTQNRSPQRAVIIDVRDSDHVGGHIKGSKHVPSSTLDWRLPELVRTLQDKPVVVFHCALSQQRGPSAALRYLRERERVHGGSKFGELDERQKVYVLEGGFVKWQEKYGEDKRLTEAYQKDIWEYGMY